MSNTTPHIHLTRMDDSELTILMSFGLLNKLCSMVGDLNNLQDIYLSTELQDVMIYEVLVPRTDSGKAIHEYKLYQFADNLTPDQGMALLAWCEAHITDFFLKRLQAASDLQNRVIQTMKG